MKKLTLLAAAMVLVSGSVLAQNISWSSGAELSPGFTIVATANDVALYENDTKLNTVFFAAENCKPSADGKYTISFHPAVAEAKAFISCEK